MSSTEDFQRRRRADRLTMLAIPAVIALALFALVADALGNGPSPTARQPRQAERWHLPATVAEIRAAVLRRPEARFRACLLKRWSTEPLLERLDLRTCAPHSPEPSQARQALRQAQYLAIDGHK